MNLDGIAKTYAKDVKKGVVYYMTYDYWPDGGMAVKLKTKVPAKEYWRGARGTALIFKGVESDHEFLVAPSAYVFSENPKLYGVGND